MAQRVVAEGSETNETVSGKVVSRVAEETGSDPLSLDPLYTAIEPDALDALFDSSGLGPNRSSARVSFTYCGCDVVVSADGSVRVSEHGQAD